jgi:hypothetical protein
VVKYKLVARQGKVFFVRDVFDNLDDAEAAKEKLENDKDVRIRGWKFWIHKE